MGGKYNGLLQIGRVSTDIFAQDAGIYRTCLKDENTGIDEYTESTVFHVKFADFLQKPVSFYEVCILAYYTKVPSWLSTAGKSGDELVSLWKDEFYIRFNELLVTDRRYVEIAPLTFNHGLTYDESYLVTSKRFTNISKVHVCSYAEAIERVSGAVSNIPSLYLVFPDIDPTE